MVGRTESGQDGSMVLEGGWRAGGNGGLQAVVRSQKEDVMRVKRRASHETRKQQSPTGRRTWPIRKGPCIDTVILHLLACRPTLEATTLIAFVIAISFSAPLSALSLRSPTADTVVICC